MKYISLVGLLNIVFFDKNKMTFIHLNREITLFNTVKNVKEESANKLTTSKLIAYNDIIPTKIYDKIKVVGIFMASGTNSLIELSIFQYESNEHRRKTGNQTTPHKTTNNKHHI